MPSDVTPRSEASAPLRLWISAAAITTVLCTAGCGLVKETQVNGQVGVSVTDDGTPDVVVAVCSGEVTRLDISSSRRDLPAAHLSSETPQRRSFSLDVQNPGDEWEGPRLERVESGVLYVVQGTGGGDLLGGGAALTTGTTEFFTQELETLSPAEVQTVKYTGPQDEQRTVLVESRQVFLQRSCPVG